MLPELQYKRIPNAPTDSIRNATHHQLLSSVKYITDVYHTTNKGYRNTSCIFFIFKGRIIDILIHICPANAHAIKIVFIVMSIRSPSLKVHPILSVFYCFTNNFHRKIYYHNQNYPSHPDTAHPDYALGFPVA